MIGASIFGGLAALSMTATITTAVSTISDPYNNSLAPKDIPGATEEYSVVFTNNSVVTLDSGTVVIKDKVPANAKLYVGTVGTSGPVAFAQGLPGSGLSYTFTSLASTTDDLDFSSDGGTTWTYAPTADSSGCDANVTNIRVKPKGTTVAGGVFSIRFRVVVK